jgi:hypothetical protein
MTRPFTNAYWTEVQVRVAFQLVKLDYKRNRVRYENPREGLAALARDLRSSGWAPLATFISAWSLRVKPGARALQNEYKAALSRAREGHTFRRVAFAGYKAGRRHDPRVTNRGVSVTIVVASDAQLSGSTDYAEGDDDV